MKTKLKILLIYFIIIVALIVTLIEMVLGFLTFDLYSKIFSNGYGLGWRILKFSERIDKKWIQYL